MDLLVLLDLDLDLISPVTSFIASPTSLVWS